MIDNTKVINVGDELPKKVIDLSPFSSCMIRVFKHVANQTHPQEVGQFIHDGSNKTINVDGGFMGLMFGKSKDPTKKYEVVLIGYPENYEKEYNAIIESKNKKTK